MQLENARDVYNPPEYILENQAIFDGDWICLGNNAWPENGGTNLMRDETPWIHTTDTNFIRRTWDAVPEDQARDVGRQANRWTWSIRKCKFNKATSAWDIDDLDFSKRTVICYGDTFILCEEGEKGTYSARCLGTGIPGNGALATNGNYGVERVKLEFKYITTPCGGSTSPFWRMFDTSGCMDFIDLSTRVWTFESLAGTNPIDMPVIYGTELTVNNYFTKAKFGHEGRMLTQKNGSPEVVKLAWDNDSRIDRSRWRPWPWQGPGKFGLRRNINAHPLPECRPGQWRTSITSTCTDPKPLPPGSYWGQNGKPVVGECPAGSTRDGVGYCNDPSANPTLDDGSVNVFYDKALHEAWLTAKEAAERRRLEEAERARIAGINCPVGTTKNQQTGECQKSDEGPGVTLDTDLSHRPACSEGYVRDPITGECAKEGIHIDPRNWWQKLFYRMFGYNFWELDKITQLEIQLGLVAMGLISAVIVVDEGAKAALRPSSSNQ